MKYITDGKRHLICEPYSISDLHLMAAALRIDRSWFHNGKFPHYDIPKKRIKEIEAKCKIVTPKELLRIIKCSQ